MKKFKNLFFILIFVLVCPLFAFGCDETKFDDVPYSSSSKTADEILTQIDDTRMLMINLIELKVSLTTTNTYTFKNLEDFGFEDKVVKDVIKTTIGKNSDNPAVAIVEKTRYENDVAKSYEQNIYYHFVAPNGKEESFVYTTKNTFDEEGTAQNLSFNRASYSQTSLNFLGLYNNVVSTIKANQIDDIKEKSFEGVHYYQLSSDINGLYYVNEAFAQNNNFYTNPSLFVYQNKTKDYVMPFVCEFGLKSTEGYNYITYSTINYEVENEERQVYLSVSSHTKLDKYGESVESVWPESEDKDKYTAHTFMDMAKQDEFYVGYQINKEVGYKNVSVAKFKETIAGENIVTSYSVEVDDNGEGAHYYMQGKEDGTFTCYKLDLEAKTYSADSSFNLEWLSVNLGLQFNKDQQDTTYYQFGSSSEYTNITIENGEISKVSSKKAGEADVLQLSILDYGNDVETLGLVTNLEGFEER